MSNSKKKEIHYTDKQLYDAIIEIYESYIKYGIDDYILNLSLKDDYNEKILLDFLTLLNKLIDKYTINVTINLTKD